MFRIIQLVQELDNVGEEFLYASTNCFIKTMSTDDDAA